MKPFTIRMKEVDRDLVMEHRRFFHDAIALAVQCRTPGQATYVAMEALHVIWILDELLLSPTREFRTDELSFRLRQEYEWRFILGLYEQGCVIIKNFLSAKEESVMNRNFLFDGDCINLSIKERDALFNVDRYQPPDLSRVTFGPLRRAFLQEKLAEFQREYETAWGDWERGWILNRWLLLQDTLDRGFIQWDCESWLAEVDRTFTVRMEDVLKIYRLCLRLPPISIKAFVA